ncbi:gluconokinase [Micromonospora sp. WMMD980]|uniref:gluconokinase n=1 Tax=Micromonospora sp. WMMD980 TaxID=3016088 RepID=UPI0024179E81|nr:gluconokinase [Micromonospora sp. WMMD980]MDG4800142.1 gluconokinase [Micromonospora sp. WMMD980]
MPQSGDDIALDSALDPLVLAMDIGSTATRGGVHDASGRRIHGLQHKVPHTFTVAPDGTSIIDPDQVTAEVEEVLDAATNNPRLGTRIAGVAMDTFAASLIAVDKAGRALTPCLTYADSRSAHAVVALREELDERAVHQRTGTRLHTSYHAPRLRWLSATQPHLVANTANWWSLGEYVLARLIGHALAGTSTVAWTGLLNRSSGEFDAELLAAAGVDPDQLSPPRNTNQPAPPASTTRWPALAKAAWFPVITDGFASNVGSGATDATVLTAATATSGALRVLLDGPAEPLPYGLWNYRVDAGRTLLGGAINDVGRAVSWARSTLRLSPALAGTLTEPPSHTTPLVLPYLTGERAPGWVGGARAVLSGVSAASDADTLFRGIVEGVAITYARVADELHSAAPHVLEVAAAGRVSNDHPEWLQILADVLGRPVTHVTRRRATQRGTALLALDALAPDAPRASRATGATYEPQPAHVEHYAQRRARFAEAYETLRRS